MSIRGDISRNKILEAGRELFAMRGFSAVTMQAIAEQAEISRGGLYRHYNSTAQIFAELIRQEQAQALASLETAKRNGVSPKIILEHYVRSRLTTLSDPKKCIDTAISEFAANSEEGKALLKRRASQSIEITEQMITFGTEQGDFSCSDPHMASIAINCLLEGMSMHNVLITFSEYEMNEILKLISKLLRT